MRKHPLIALIAFTFVAASIFIGANGVSSINNSVPARATSHLNNGGSGPSMVATTNLRWLAATVRERAAASAQLTAVIAHEKYLPFWQGLAGDRVAIHDGGRPPKVLLPSAWRQLQQARARSAAAARAVARAAAQAAQVAQAAQAARAAQAAQAAQAARAAQAAKAAVAARVTRTTRTTRTTITRVTKAAAPIARTPAPATKPSRHSDLGGAWFELRLCESGNNYGEDTGNGYYGAYQFALATWWGLGYSGLPSNASPALQDQAAEKLQAEAGWGQWPACSASLGL